METDNRQRHETEGVRQKEPSRRSPQQNNDRTRRAPHRRGRRRYVNRGGLTDNLNDSLNHSDGTGSHTNTGKSEVINDNNVHICKWKHEKTIEYKNNIDVDKVNELLLNVISKYDDISSVDQGTVDGIVSDITTVLLSAAKDTFGVFTKNSKNTGGKGNFSNKDWFNKDCKKVRQEFRNTEDFINTIDLIYLKKDFDSQKKHYKKVMDENIKLYNKTCALR
ncbi:unnamed protein product [Mytilus coruscus]|uniref:Uncharacterized protein n=1 Tax=Mytilus coruscus TaxID=42192 RepID=A0A6J8A7W1_MYTCO|nr:unnamed protein product [Mytilus coruscus]